MQAQNSNGDKIKLSGLWKKRSQSGDGYLGATLKNGARISVFKNKSKRKDSDPDYDLVITNLPKKKVAPDQDSTAQESNGTDEFDILAMFGIDEEELLEV